jgi:Tfp pilus assembly protein PilO
MEQQAQNQPPATPGAPAPQQAPAKKSNVWLWVIGGCLGILVLIGLAVMALGWWGVRKVKKEIKENQPRLEEFQKGAQEWSKNAEEWQKQAEEMQKQAEEFQKNMPVPPVDPNFQGVPELE